MKEEWYFAMTEYKCVWGGDVMIDKGDILELIGLSDLNKRIGGGMRDDNA